MAQIVAKQGTDHTFILIDENDVIIAERVAGLNLNRAISELQAIAAEQGLVIAEKPAAGSVPPAWASIIESDGAFLAAQRNYILTGRRTRQPIGKGW